MRDERRAQLIPQKQFYIKMFFYNTVILARLGTRYVTANDPPYEREFTAQPRANVLFEAGMAFGQHPERTVLVGLGYSRPFSDVAGRHILAITNDVKHRQALADRLKTVGCAL